MHLSSPPVEIKYGLFFMNLTFVTWEEWPIYYWKHALSTGQGYLNNLTIPKSSAVANTVPSGDLSTALISEPSAQGGNMP